ncbi:hypothetical protein CSW38_11175 [Thermus scotoductus]|uniref:Chromosome partition protein Smc n=1 Tax=Thermus scotoductus TaxID=37636 RepID=A0A430R0Z8_THESC|nr:hypothetical protein CSW51_11395 [Thermus scotoductus]RTH00997.1 hypothetical protein CSW47_12960 [Thermus scotoductus]RTH23206.1 hypothetical protein CSW38_11175 [Thermus scotoductus]
MAELEEVLREVARKVLGLPEEPLPSRPWRQLPPDFKTLSPPPLPKGPPGKGVGAPPRPSEEGGLGPASAEQEPLRKLRECERKFQRKAKEVEKLEVKLQRAQKAVQEAERDRGRALEEAAHWRKEASRFAAERDRLGAEMARVQEAYAKLRADWAELEKEVEVYKRSIDALEARLRELEGVAEQKAHLEAELARLRNFKEALPEPFPQEALLRVLVLDYPGLGNRPEERVLALIEGYRALLKGEDHPALRHSNRELLAGEPEGMVLLGLERLLLDLASLPLSRWLRTHAFRLEAWLQAGEQPSSPRLREE